MASPPLNPNPPPEENLIVKIVSQVKERVCRFIIDHPVPYYVVLSTNKDEFFYAIDSCTKQSVKEWKDVDLKIGCKDSNVPFKWVSDLELDLFEFGFKSVLASETDEKGTIPATPVPTGIFSERTAAAVRRFQLHASRPERNGKSVVVTFKGKINGIMDDDTKREVKIWKEHNYKRSLQPFDPEKLLETQKQKGLLCPEFVDVLYGKFSELCDAEDLELYGPSSESYDPDAYRASFPYLTWHLAGLGCDLNFYSYSDKFCKPGKRMPKTEDFVLWMKPDLRRLWDIAHRCGLATCPTNEQNLKDPRHVEYHPLLNNISNAEAWTTPPPSVQQYIDKDGGNSLADIRMAWGLAVSTKYIPLNNAAIGAQNAATGSNNN